jgi:hypothetical protein
MAASTGLLAGYCGLTLATGLAIAAGGTRRPAVALGLLGLAVLVVAMRTSWPAALGVGTLGWLFYDGFFIGRHANLAEARAARRGLPHCPASRLDVRNSTGLGCA